MASKLFEDLMNLPLEYGDFDQLDALKLEALDDDADSFGSCCSSPTQSSDCASPTQTSDRSNGCNECHENDSDESDFFTYPTSCANEKFTPKKKQTKLENKIKRNERERRRVRRLAEGFRKLRGVVPGEAKKLSKLQTLQNALQYMAQLSGMITQNLQESGSSSEENIHSPQMYSPPPTSYHQQSQQTKTLSHPPLNWPYSPVHQTPQQMYGPIIDQFMFSPTQPQPMNVPVWYYT